MINSDQAKSVADFIKGLSTHDNYTLLSFELVEEKENTFLRVSLLSTNDVVTTANMVVREDGTFEKIETNGGGVSALVNKL